MPNVIIVDDVESNLNSLFDYIDIHSDISGLRLIKANSDESARVLIGKLYEGGEKIDVLITDMRMEANDSGVSLISFAHSIDPTTMAILYTANESRLDRMSVFEFGAFEVIEKNMLQGDSSAEILLKTKMALQFKKRFEDAATLRTYLDKGIAARIEVGEQFNLKKYMLTVAFWDVRGFSFMCEQLKENPDLISEFIREYNAVAVEIINNNGGIVDKFIGDGIMALYIPNQDDPACIKDSALNAIKSAIQIRDRFRDLVRTHSRVWSQHSAQEISIDIGCGIHTAPVLFGDLGNSKRRNITAIGSNVNLASRIEGYSNEGKILISLTSLSYCRDNLEYDEDGVIDNIKNIPGNYPLFSVKALKI